MPGLFSDGAELKVLILWASAENRTIANEVAKNLKAATPNCDFKTILERHDEPRYNEVSKSAIDEADVVLMVAGEKDWDSALSAKLEWEYFQDRRRRTLKRANQFRFVKVGGREVPIYESGGQRPLVFRQPASPAAKELQSAVRYLADEAAIKAGTPYQLRLPAESIKTPEGLLAATLWMITLDPSVLAQADRLEREISAKALTGGLRYLKALHSVHSGIGAILEGPMSDLNLDSPAPGPLNITAKRTQLSRAFAQHDQDGRSRVREELENCIAGGLLPFMRSLELRFGSFPRTENERHFILAAIDRLNGILQNSSEVDPLYRDLSGEWWVDGYLLLIDRLQNEHPALDPDLRLELIALDSAGTRVNTCLETFADVRALHAASLKLAFLLIVLFSFLHAHRMSKIPGLMVGDVDIVLEQATADWANGPASRQVVKLSNAVILRHLAAIEDYEAMVHAAA